LTKHVKTKFVFITN